MDIEAFVQSRRESWARLEQALQKAENVPAWEFGPERIRELVALYRQACSDLNRARTLTANPEILDRLNQLTGQAYRFIYREGRRRTAQGAFVRFVMTDIPLAFQRHGTALLAALGALLLGALVGFAAVLHDPGYAEDLVPPMFFNASPSERVQRIETGAERIDNTGEALQFGAFLYTHNIRVAFLAFGLGALTLCGAALLLFYNGALLGAVAATYVLDSEHVFFLAWVGPHGALELPAICFAGATGMVFGRALLLPGNLSRAASVRQVFPAVFRMLVAVVALLFCAGLIEGSFSQFSTRIVSYPVKIAVAAGLLVTLALYLGLPRRSALETPQ